jgi:hypothetical protein
MVEMTVDLRVDLRGKNVKTFEVEEKPNRKTRCRAIDYIKGSEDGFDRGERKQMCVISASCHGLDFMIMC